MWGRGEGHVDGRASQRTAEVRRKVLLGTDGINSCSSFCASSRMCSCTEEVLCVSGWLDGGVMLGLRAWMCMCVRVG